MSRVLLALPAALAAAAALTAAAGAAEPPAAVPLPDLDVAAPADLTAERMRIGERRIVRLRFTAAVENRGRGAGRLADHGRYELRTPGDDRPSVRAFAGTGPELSLPPGRADRRTRRHVDVTDAPARRYVLVHAVNGDRALPEASHANNAASVLFALTWPEGRDGMPRIVVLRRCAASASCPA